MTPFELHLARRATCFFLLCAGILFCFGLELAFFHTIFGPEDLTAQPIPVYLLALLFFGGVPLLIWARLVPYLFSPPLLLRVDEKNITVGTGWGYTPTTIPTEHLTGVHAGVAMPDGSTLRPEGIVGHGGLVLTFADHPDVPRMLVTSAGIRYTPRRIVISRLYANRSLRRSVEAILPFIPPSTHSSS